MSQSRSRSGRGSPSSRNGKRSSSSGYQSDRRYDSHASKGASSGHLEDVSEVDINLMSENISIEADGEYDDGGDIGAIVADEDLDAAFEAEQGCLFHIVDEVGADKTEESEQNISCHSDGERKETPGEGRERKKFVIPKLKRTESEKQYEAGCSSSDEGKREWRKNERDSRSKDRDAGRREKSRGDRDRDRGRRDSRERLAEREKHRSEKESPNGESAPQSRGHATVTKPSQGRRTNLFDSFVAEGLISAEDHVPLPASEPVQQELKPAEEEAACEEVAQEVTGTGQDEAVGKEGERMAVPMEEEGALEIPLGRDSLVFVRDYYPWQVRVHPVSKMDMPRADFAQVWAMADSSSVVWSSHKNFGGVAEFLLKDRDGIQKFMRKILWHNYSSDVITVEITERVRSDVSSSLGQGGADASFDSIINQAVFQLNNTRARQLIKTYYPTPKGEVTERSLYVNNVGTGVSTDLMKAIFPCALKISVAKAGKEASSALVETESEEATFNYLVVYQQIRINGLDLVLSSVGYDWEGAKKKFMESEGETKKTDTKDAMLDGKKKTDTTGAKPDAKKGKDATDAEKKANAKAGGRRKEDAKPVLLQTPLSRPAKRPSTTEAGGGPLKKDRPTSFPRDQGRTLPQRGRGGAPRGGLPLRGGAPRGRGGAAPMGRGRALLPDPVVGGGEGLLPHPDSHHPPPLLAVPAQPSVHGLHEADMMLSHDLDPHTAELQQIQQRLESQVLETRASLVRAVRQAEVEALEAELESRLAQLDQAHRTGMAGRPRRPLDYAEDVERPREAPRRALLHLEGRPRLEREDLVDEQVDYRRARPLPALERDYVSRDYPRDRREEDYGEQRPSVLPRPYLLKAPEIGVAQEEKDPYATPAVYSYEHSSSRSRLEPDREARHALLSRGAAGERPRPGFPEERGVPRSRENYDYEGREPRRPAAYPGGHGGYEEEGRRAPPPARYRDEYDHRY